MTRPAPASGDPPGASGARSGALPGAAGLPGARALSGARRYRPAQGLSGARNAVRFHILPADEFTERGAPRDHGVYRSGLQVGTIYGITREQWKIAIPHRAGGGVAIGWASSYAEAESEALRLLNEMGAR